MLRKNVILLFCMFLAATSLLLPVGEKEAQYEDIMAIALDPYSFKEFVPPVYWLNPEDPYSFKESVPSVYWLDPEGIKAIEQISEPMAPSTKPQPAQGSAAGKAIQAKPARKEPESTPSAPVISPKIEQVPSSQPAKKIKGLEKPHKPLPTWKPERPTTSQGVISAEPVIQHPAKKDQPSTKEPQRKATASKTSLVGLATHWWTQKTKEQIEFEQLGESILRLIEENYNKLKEISVPSLVGSWLTTMPSSIPEEKLDKAVKDILMAQDTPMDKKLFYYITQQRNNLFTTANKIFEFIKDAKIFNEIIPTLNETLSQMDQYINQEADYIKPPHIKSPQPLVDKVLAYLSEDLNSKIRSLFYNHLARIIFLAQLCKTQKTDDPVNIFFAQASKLMEHCEKALKQDLQLKLELQLISNQLTSIIEEALVGLKNKHDETLPVYVEAQRKRIQEQLQEAFKKFTPEVDFFAGLKQLNFLIDKANLYFNREKQFLDRAVSKELKTVLAESLDNVIESILLNDDKDAPANPLAEARNIASEKLPTGKKWAEYGNFWGNITQLIGKCTNEMQGVLRTAVGLSPITKKTEKELKQLEKGIEPQAKISRKGKREIEKFKKEVETPEEKELHKAFEAVENDLNREKLDPKNKAYKLRQIRLAMIHLDKQIIFCSGKLLKPAQKKKSKSAQENLFKRMDAINKRIKILERTMALAKKIEKELEEKSTKEKTLK